jgi:hypothetical protein
MVSNSITVAGMPLNKNRSVSMNDGLLEVLLIKKPSFPFDVEAALNSLQTLEGDSPFFYSFKVKQLRVVTLGETNVPWTLDGEYGGDDRDITIGVLPSALNILVPNEPAPAHTTELPLETGPEKTLCHYALGVVVLGAVLALTAAILHGFDTGLRVYAAALLAAVPASTFVSIQRPAAILERRMHKLGTVLCGWRGLQNIEKHGFYPLQHEDLFPENHVKLNGVRFYGERNVSTIVSYVSALMAADGGALAVPFEQLRSSRNARICRVEELTSYPDGIGGQIDGLSVVAGTVEFMENMGVALPDGARIPYGVYAAVNQSLCAVFAVSFTRSKSSASGLRTLCDSGHVRPILVDCDFILTEPFLEEKLGVDAHRMQFPDCMTRMKLAEKEAPADAPAIALATRGGLAQRAYAVTGGAALRSAWRVGAAVHILGGGIGFLAVAILALQGSLFLLTPYNLLLYGFVWMIPGLLMAEWTRSV